LGCTVEELLARISSRELTEWMAYFAIDPFGEERADLRAGIVASTLVNVNRGKRGKAAKPRDFMPSFGEDNGRGMLSIIKQLHVQLGGE
jgi:hypothetical protein